MGISLVSLRSLVCDLCGEEKIVKSEEMYKNAYKRIFVARLFYLFNKQMRVEFKITFPNKIFDPITICPKCYKNKELMKKLFEEVFSIFWNELFEEEEMQ